MPAPTDDTSNVTSDRRLTVRLTKFGELERVLEFHAGNDGARVIGCAPSSDVVLRDAGVLPVHCYFERDAGNIWLAAAQDAAAIRVNYQPIVGRVKLPARSILEVGHARMQVLVLDADENAPRHGPFGTQVVEPVELDAPADLFATKPVAASLALGELATAAWSRTDLDVTPNKVGGRMLAATASTATLEYNLRPEHPPKTDAGCPRPPMASGQRVPFEALTTTARIPRPNPAGAFAAEPVQPVVPSPCIPVPPQRRLFPTASIAPPLSVPESSEGQRLQGAASAPGAARTLSGSGALSHEQASSAASAASSATPASASAMPVGFLIDPASFTTVGHPIPDLLAAVEPAVPSNPSRPKKRAGTSVAQLRQRFAAGPGREPKVVALVAFCAALSLTALAAQSVRAWRQIAVPVVKGTSNGGHAVGAHAPTAHGTAPSANEHPSAASSALVVPGGGAVESSSGDALVAKAVSHLLLGEQVEAAEAYGVLAARYPSEPAYATVAKLLRRRLNPACREGSKAECGKVAP